MNHANSPSYYMVFPHYVPEGPIGEILLEAGRRGIEAALC